MLASNYSEYRLVPWPVYFRQDMQIVPPDQHIFMETLSPLAKTVPGATFPVLFFFGCICR